jgi:hypothetical protein
MLATLLLCGVRSAFADCSYLSDRPRLLVPDSVRANFGSHSYSIADDCLWALVGDSIFSLPDGRLLRAGLPYGRYVEAAGNVLWTDQARQELVLLRPGISHVQTIPCAGGCQDFSPSGRFVDCRPPGGRGTDLVVFDLEDRVVGAGANYWPPNYGSRPATDGDWLLQRVGVAEPQRGRHALWPECWTGVPQPEAGAFPEECLAPTWRRVAWTPAFPTPDWSSRELVIPRSEGRTIVYQVCSSDAGATCEIWWASLEHSPVLPILVGGTAYPPVVLPDPLVAFWTAGGVRILDAATGEVRGVPVDPLLNGNDLRPSPSGRFVLVQLGLPGSACAQIVVIDAASATITRPVFEANWGSRPEWSDSERTVALAACGSDWLEPRGAVVAEVHGDGVRRIDDVLILDPNHVVRFVGDTSVLFVRGALTPRRGWTSGPVAEWSETWLLDLQSGEELYLSASANVAPLKGNGRAFLWVEGEVERWGQLAEGPWLGRAGDLVWTAAPGWQRLVLDHDVFETTVRVFDGGRAVAYVAGPSPPAGHLFARRLPRTTLSRDGRR